MEDIPASNLPTGPPSVIIATEHLNNPPDGRSAVRAPLHVDAARPYLRPEPHRAHHFAHAANRGVYRRAPGVLEGAICHDRFRWSGRYEFQGGL